MGSFDDLEEMFRRLGLSEAGAKIAATGRYRSEAEARDAERADEVEDLADDLLTEAQSRPTAAFLEAAQVQAAIPDAAANTVRLMQGLPAQPYPWQQTTALPAAAEAIVETVREKLRMPASDARVFAGRLHQREVRRGGQAHADRFVTEFEEALQGKNGRLVREVAP